MADVNAEYEAGVKELVGKLFKAIEDAPDAILWYIHARYSDISSTVGEIAAFNERYNPDWND